LYLAVVSFYDLHGALVVLIIPVL